MKLVSFPKKSNWSSSARVFAVLLLAGIVVFAQDDAKARIKAIRELSKEGSTAVPRLAGYVSDSDQDVRLEAVKAIVQLDTQASLDPLVKATADNSAEIQIRATDGLVNFYLPGYVQAGLGSTFKKVGTSIKSRFTDTNDQVIDGYVKVRPDIIQALGKVARGGVSMEARAGAARALGILRGQAALPDLLVAIHSNDTEVNYEALIALQKIRDKSAGPEIAFRLRDPSEKVQAAAIETTGLLDNRAALNQIRDAMDRSKSAKVRRIALTALAMMPDASSHGVFVYRLEDKDEAMRVAALEGLARLRDAQDEARLKKAFDEEKKAPGRLAAAFGLVTHGQREMTEFGPLRYLVNQLNSAAYRGVASSYLKEVARDPAVRQALYPALQASPSKDEKTGLAEVLGASGDRDSIPVLETLSKDAAPDVAKEALRALQTLRARISG
jgi:HEAT repeat protein